MKQTRRAKYLSFAPFISKSVSRLKHNAVDHVINNVPRSEGSRPTGGVNHTEGYELRFEREPPTETKGKCVLWQPMDTSSVLYERGTKERKKERKKEGRKERRKEGRNRVMCSGESEGRKTRSEENETQVEGNCEQESALSGKRE
ncbi:hypothetical protein K0M31_005481 [Melipona bicolor]|uniref:Uncharacterized protein n=1 Tax=Melipona bicolor TaxID=60889 RepID=A0AA40FW41_9HYME|nr:hypothetical protein K0M31_005481 [Melipona bicolor]